MQSYVQQESHRILHLSLEMPLDILNLTPISTYLKVWWIIFMNAKY